MRTIIVNRIRSKRPGIKILLGFCLQSIANLLFVYSGIFFNLHFLNDSVIKTSTYIKYLIPLNILLFIFLINLLAKDSIMHNLRKLRGNRIFSFIKIKPSLAIEMLLAFYLALTIYTLIKLDISTDESTYMSTYQTYYNKNTLLFKTANDVYVIPKDMLGQHLVLPLIKPFTSFTKYLPRTLTMLFSFLLLLVFLYIWKIKYDYTHAMIFMILAISSPMFIYLSSSAFAENISLFYLVIAWLCYEKNHKSKSTIWKLLFYLFSAISILTKLQLGITFYSAALLFIIYRIIRREPSKEFIKDVFMILLFSAVLFVFKLSFNEHEEVLSLLKNIAESSKTLGVNSVQGFFDGYPRALVRFFSSWNILLFPLVAAALITFKKYSTCEKFMFLMVLTNLLWYLHKSYTFRFGYFSHVFLLVLAVKPIVLLINDSRPFNSNFIKSILLVFCLVGVSQSVIYAYIGNSNKYQFYLNGDASLKVSDAIKKDNSQSIFYDKTSKILKKYDKVYFIGPEDEMAAFIENKFQKIDLQSDAQIKGSGSYIIIAAITYQIGSLSTAMNDFLKNKTDLIFKSGDYELYRIK